MASQKAISLPFSINENYGIGFAGNENKIWKDRVFLAVMTGFNERVMRPNYGSQVKQVIFEDEATAILVSEETVKSCFNTWLTSLKLTNVQSELDLESMQLTITINYILPNQTTDVLLLNLGTFTRTGDLIEGNE